MWLNTTGAIPFSSPFLDLEGKTSIAPGEAFSLAQLANRVAMGAVQGCGLLELRGAAAGEALARAFSARLAQTGAVLATQELLVTRLRQGHWLLLTPSQAQIGTVAQSLRDASTDELLTFTDLTHGLGCMLLFGPHAPDVLAKLCGLDFSDAAFPNPHSAQASLAKVKALILRLDLPQQPAYLLSVDRSLSRYVWQAVAEELQEYDGIILEYPIGTGDWPPAPSGAGQ